MHCGDCSGRVFIVVVFHACGSTAVAEAQVPGVDVFQRSFGRNYGELASQREQRGPPQRLAGALCPENLLPVRHPAMRRSLPSAQWRFAIGPHLLRPRLRDSRLSHYKLPT